MAVSLMRKARSLKKRFGVVAMAVSLMRKARSLKKSPQMVLGQLDRLPIALCQEACHVFDTTLLSGDQNVRGG